MPWTVVSGPRSVDRLGTFQVEGGWGYTIERSRERRTISVLYTRSARAASNPPDDVRRALSTRGRSALDAVLDRDDPPRVIVVGSLGLAEHAEIA